MIQRRTASLALVALLALAACDSGTPEAEQPAPASEAPAAQSANTLPAALQGRWGLTQADCTTGPAAEGLLTIGPASLEFYESTATLESVEQSSPTTARAHFAFTGEGMDWQREMDLSLDQNGTTLTRREYGEDAAEAPISYVKCPAAS